MNDRTDEYGAADPVFSDTERTAIDPVTGDAPFTDTTWNAAPDATGTSGGYIDDTGDEDVDLAAQRAQVEETRARMSETIDAIQEKVSPSNVAQEAKQAVHDATIGQVSNTVSNLTDTASSALSSVTDTASNALSSVTGSTGDTVSSAGETVSSVGGGLVRAIRQNPIPAALAGFGIGWLIMSMRSGSSGSQKRSSDRQYRYGYSGSPRSQQGYGYRPSQQQYGYSGGGQTENSPSGIGAVAGSAEDAVSGAVGSVQDAASGVAGTVQDTASNVASSAGNVAGQVQATAGQALDTAQYGAQQAVSSAQSFLQQRPLAVGAIALALGAAVGLAVPETQKEDQLFSGPRQDLVDRAQQTAQDTIEKAQTVVGEAVDTAKHEAHRQGLT